MFTSSPTRSVHNHLLVLVLFGVTTLLCSSVLSVEQSYGYEGNHMYWRLDNETDLGDGSSYFYTQLLNSVVEKMQIPDFQTSYMYPVHQPYFPTPFSFDAKRIDMCNTSQIQTDGFNRPLNVTLGGLDCVDFFCKERLFTMSTRLERFTFSRMINYCLYCKNDNAERFRQYIKNDNRTRDGWSDLEALSVVSQTNASVRCPIFPEFYSMKNRLTRQCNSANSILTNDTSNLAFGIVNEDIFNYESYYGQLVKKHVATVGRGLTALELFNVTTVEEQKNLQNPFICYCYGRNMYGFQCDAYSLFFSPLVNDWFPLFLAIAYSFMIFAMVCLTCIPSLHLQKKLIERKVASENNSWLRLKIVIGALFNIRLQTAYWLVSACFFIWLENIHDLGK